MHPNVDTRFYRHSGLLFHIYVLCTSRTGQNLPVKGRRVRSIPPAMVDYLRGEADAQQAVFAAIDQQMCWFMRVEDRGWRPGQRRGDREVQMVQTVLDWLGRFGHQQTVDGSRLLYAAIETSLDVPA